MQQDFPWKSAAWAFGALAAWITTTILLPETSEAALSAEFHYLMAAVCITAAMIGFFLLSLKNARSFGDTVDDEADEDEIDGKTT